MHLFAWLAVYGLAGLAKRRSTGAGAKTVRDVLR
jgi:hypothetical protein